MSSDYNPRAVIDPDPSPGLPDPIRSAPRARADLFAISLLVLFLELACIRWFPAHVLFLTFFTNTVLLAGFLGMSVGCLVTRHRRNYLAWTPLLLVLALGSAHLVEIERLRTRSIIDVGNQASPQLVFFGVEYQAGDPSSFVIPIEVLCGVFFFVIALVHVGPGQKLGRALGGFTNRVEAYTLNILGSIGGVVLFAACSRAQLSPVWWFGIVLAALAYFLLPARPIRALMFGAAASVVLLMVLPATAAMEFWSPYYRIDYAPESKLITVNLIGHQQMVSRDMPFPAYALPYLLNRDAGRPPIARVLIIGAGSGNDVSRALEWGATHVDAVEIDPVIYRLGRSYHPDRPYHDPRVTVYLDDGRNFLRSSRKKYDLIVYALVDSLVLHSSYSNIRLESYLFTKEAFADVRDHLKPDGLFVMYNYFRHGWVVGRLQKTLEETFGPNNPLALSLPARPTIAPDQVLFDEFTVFMAGATDPIRAAFARQPEYWLRENAAPNPGTPNGFEMPAPAERASWRLAGKGHRQSGWLPFSPTVVVPPAEQQRLATDDWPFLYLRTPGIPALSLRGMAIMGSIAAALIVPVVWRRRPRGSEAGEPAARQHWGFALQMFFLGAGFMLIETKAVVHMALLFGSTWTVNSIVFFAVLVTILIANVFVLATRPARVWPYYVGLLTTLAASALVPMDVFLGRPWPVQVIGSCVLAFAPIVFAGVVFALRFGRAAEPDWAFGANVAGATVGGLAEYSSMVLGFQHLVLVALAFYALSALGGWAADERRST